MTVWNVKKNLRALRNWWAEEIGELLSPNWSFDMYTGPGGVTLRFRSLTSLDLPRSILAVVYNAGCLLVMYDIL